MKKSKEEIEKLTIKLIEKVNKETRTLHSDWSKDKLFWFKKGIKMACQNNLQLKMKKSKEEIEKLFNNNSDCYADTWHIKGDNMIEGEVIPAMTRDRFVKVYQEYQEQPSEIVEQPAKTQTNAVEYKHISSKENYDKRLGSGMFWEFHPELSGIWENDCKLFKE